MIDRIKPGPYGARNHFLERVAALRADEQTSSRASLATTKAHHPENKSDRRTKAMSGHQQRAAEIAALRAKGFTWDEVAKAMGLSVASAQRSDGITRTGDLEWGR